MRVTTTTCDRCSAVIDPVETVELNFVTTVTTDDEEGGYSEMWDLCPDCRDAIRTSVLELLDIPVDADGE